MRVGQAPDLSHQGDLGRAVVPVEDDGRPHPSTAGDHTGDRGVVLVPARFDLAVVVDDDHGARVEVRLGGGQRLGVVGPGEQEITGHLDVALDDDVALEPARRVALPEDAGAIVAELEPADRRLAGRIRDAFHAVAGPLAVAPHARGARLRDGVGLAVDTDPGVADPYHSDRALPLHAPSSGALAQHSRAAIAVGGEVVPGDAGGPDAAGVTLHPRSALETLAPEPRRSVLSTVGLAVDADPGPAHAGNPDRPVATDAMPPGRRLGRAEHPMPRGALTEHAGRRAPPVHTNARQRRGVVVDAHDPCSGFGVAEPLHPEPCDRFPDHTRLFCRVLPLPINPAPTGTPSVTVIVGVVMWNGRRLRHPGVSAP